MAKKLQEAPFLEPTSLEDADTRLTDQHMRLSETMNRLRDLNDERTQCGDGKMLPPVHWYQRKSLRYTMLCIQREIVQLKGWIFRNRRLANYYVSNKLLLGCYLILAQTEDLTTDQQTMVTLTKEFLETQNMLRKTSQSKEKQ